MDKRKLIDESKTFCMMPWVHQYINTTGDVFPCCTASYDYPVGNVKTHSIKDIWNNDKYKQIRYNMLNEVKSPSCTNCYKHEEASVELKSSFRHWANKDFGEYIDLVDDTLPDGTLPNMDLKYLDVRWSNICNFKCRMCGDWFSSSWAAEAKQNWKKDDKSYPILIKATDDNDALLEQFKPYLSGMKIVYFAGGEPLITPEHYQVLDFLIEKKTTDMLLRYNSNVSVLKYKDKSITEYWKQFSKVDLYASLESWGTRAEYIRNGTVWPEIVENLKHIKAECPHVNIQYNTVIGIWNVMTLVDFLEELERLQLFNPYSSSLTLYRQLNPEYQSLQLLPDTMKQEAKARILEYSDRPGFSPGLTDRLNEILEFIDQPVTPNPALLKEFKMHATGLDAIRKESFVDTFPELKDWYNTI